MLSSLAIDLPDLFHSNIPRFLANLEFVSIIRPFEIRSTLIYSLNKSLDNSGTQLEFHRFLSRIPGIVVFANETKKKKKEKKRKKKEKRELENRCHRARTLASKLTFLSASTRFAYTWFAQEFHSNQRNEDRSLDWPIRC